MLIRKHIALNAYIKGENSNQRCKHPLNKLENRENIKCNGSRRKKFNKDLEQILIKLKIKKQEKNDIKNLSFEKINKNGKPIVRITRK